MANKFVSLGSFRRDIVNKRSDPDYAELDEPLLNDRYIPISETQYCYVLNECIYNEDTSDLRVYYMSGETAIEISEYIVNATSAVITFDNGYSPIGKNLYCHYKGGGSIVWVEDVKDIQKVVTDMDANTVYTDGSNFMIGDLKMGEGTSENPYRSIVNVNLVDGIDVSAHNHTGNTNGSLIPTAGIENGAIIESKIANNAVTNVKIINSAVTNDKIRTETITAEKFNSSMIGNGLKRTTAGGVANSILQTNIDNSSIVYNSGVMQVPIIVNLTGVVVPFAGAVAPAGWLLCDGTSYNTNEYTKLFNVIGYRYGGSGSVFKVPDFRGKTFWGGDSSNVGTDIEAGIPNIKGEHSLKGNYAYRSGTTTVGAFQLGSYTGKTRTAGDSSSNYDVYRMAFDASNGEIHKDLNDNEIYRNDVYGKSETVQPPAIQMMFIIKT